MCWEWKVGHCDAIFWGNEGNCKDLKFDFNLPLVGKYENVLNFQYLIFTGQSTEICQWWYVSRYCYIYDIA